MVTRRLLRERGYRLQANAKTTDGGQHVDRDAQFAYLNEQQGDLRLQRLRRQKAKVKAQPGLTLVALSDQST